MVWRVDHELRRNVIVFGEAGLENFTFDNDDREDDDFARFGLGATYKLNKHAHIDAYYNYYDRSTGSNAGIGGADFGQNVVGVAIRLYP